MHISDKRMIVTLTCCIYVSTSEFMRNQLQAEKKTLRSENKHFKQIKETHKDLICSMTAEGTPLPPTAQAMRQTASPTYPSSSCTTQALRVLIRKPMKQTNARKHERPIHTGKNKSFAALHQYLFPCVLHLSVVFG